MRFCLWENTRQRMVFTSWPNFEQWTYMYVLFCELWPNDPDLLACFVCSIVPGTRLGTRLVFCISAAHTIMCGLYAYSAPSCERTYEQATNIGGPGKQWRITVTGTDWEISQRHINKQSTSQTILSTMCLD